MSVVRRALVASAPSRLDFGGGWTDVPPYPEERGGFVCNLAINRRATVQLSHGASSASDDRLVSAAMRRAGVTDLDVRIASDFPVGAGLGGSSAAGVALAAALHAYRFPHTPPDATQLAEWSRAVEVDELGIAGGRQDHYAAAYGGALALTFESDTRVERIPLSTAATAQLERQCLLAYTGESRISGTTITAVLDAYRDRVPRVLAALDRMAQLARQMRDALHDGAVESLAALVDEHWRHQRGLHPGITTARIDALEHAARAAGAVGMKALGASGGGCVIVFAPDNRVDETASAIAPFATLLSWRVDPRGAIVTSEG